MGCMEAACGRMGRHPQARQGTANSRSHRQIEEAVRKKVERLDGLAEVENCIGCLLSQLEGAPCEYRDRLMEAAQMLWRWKAESEVVVVLVRASGASRI